MSSLDAFPLLRELSEADRAQLGEHLEERTLEAETQLYQPGDEADFMVLIREGRLRLERDGEALGSFGKGETLGALSLSVIGRRPVSARAEEPCVLWILDRPSYHRLRSDAPEIALSLQEAILRDFSRAVEALLTRGADSPTAELDGAQISD
ncbi:MAG: cyclic nucleotide-binding domain-containing protein [Myxococcota bacterium]